MVPLYPLWLCHLWWSFVLSLIGSLPAFSLACPLFHNKKEEELVCTGHDVSGVFLWCLSFLLDHSGTIEASVSGTEHPQTPVCSEQLTAGPLWLGKATWCLWGNTNECRVNSFSRMNAYLLPSDTALVTGWGSHSTQVRLGKPVSLLGWLIWKWVRVSLK